jgi:hypothetical protein
MHIVTPARLPVASFCAVQFPAAKDVPIAALLLHHGFESVLEPIQQATYITTLLPNESKFCSSL